MERFATFFDLLCLDAQCTGQLCLLFRTLRHELVQRRVEETDGHRQTLHGLHRAFQRGLDEWEEFTQGRPALFGGTTEDHLTEIK